MELLHTGGIVSTEVEVKQTDDLRAWLRKRKRKRERERERRQCKPQWKSDGQVASSDHGSPALGRSTLIEPHTESSETARRCATADTLRAVSKMLPLSFARCNRELRCRTAAVHRYPLLAERVSTRSR